MLKKRIIVRFFALIFSAVLLSQECFLQVPAQWEVNENQTVSFDSKYSLSNGSQKTSSFEVSYGSQQVRGYNEEEKNPYSLAGFLKHTAKGALEGAAENAVFYGVEKVFGAAKNVLSCFVAGTLIKTSEGLIPIEEIRVGDEVFAYNIENGETELKEVKQLFVHEEDELVHLVINGEKIDTTTNHPFFVEDLGFISAKDLQDGDELRLYDGSTASVEAIEIEVLDEPVLVYNFEVEDFHTYFVGEQSVLVHNTCGQKGGRKTVDVKLSKKKYPESAQHIEEAIKEGQPDTLTIDKGGASARRKASLQGVDTVLGLDRDEYPPAMSMEGGSGASVKLINSSDNRGSGSSISGQLRKYPNGTKYRIIITDED